MPHDRSAHIAQLSPRAIVLAGLLVASSAWAGPSLDEAVARHRAMLGAGEEGTGLSPILLDDGVAEDDITLAVGGPGNGIPPLLGPQERGEGGLQLKSRTAWFGGVVDARLGAAWWAGDDHPWSLDGSSLSVSAGPGRFYASVERRHWGPSWVGSLILDAGARPVPAVGWRKEGTQPFESPWLRWLGPWTADVFAGQLEQRKGPSHAHLLGARFEFMPLDGLELGVSRTIQWGGSGRPESLRSLYDALIGNDNVGTSLSPQDEPGNQLAGFDARYTLHLGRDRSFSVYAQAIGEDDAGNLPSHYLGSGGLDAAFRLGTASVRTFVEHANTTVRGAFADPLFGVAYQHHIYIDGYTQQGDPLGFPAGGDIVLNSIGAIVDAGPWSGELMAHRGGAYQTSTLYPGGGRLSGFDADVAWRVDARSRVGISLRAWSDPLGSRTRAQLWWQLGLT